jgi:hypothetical protein
MEAVMDKKQAIAVIRELAPELHANDSGKQHVNISRYPGGPVHSIMPPQDTTEMPMRWEDQVEHIRRMIADADRMLPAMPLDEGEDEVVDRNGDDDDADDDEAPLVSNEAVPVPLKAIKRRPKPKPAKKAAKKKK